MSASTVSSGPVRQVFLSTYVHADRTRTFAVSVDYWDTNQLHYWDPVSLADAREIAGGLARMLRVGVRELDPLYLQPVNPLTLPARVK